MVSRRSIIGYLSIILLSTIPDSPISSMLFYAPAMSKVYTVPRISTLLISRTSSPTLIFLDIVLWCKAGVC